MLKILIGAAVGGYLAWHYQRWRYVGNAEHAGPECLAAVEGSPFGRYLPS